MRPAPSAAVGLSRLAAPIVLALAVAVCSPAIAAAKTGAGATAPARSPNDPTSAELVERWETWNGKTVTFTGEAVGERMARGGYAWIHINDDAYYERNIEEGARLGGYNSGHAVWLPASEAAEIGFFGDYKHEGDIVTVRGTFNAACGQHGGDMDIHATSLVVDVRGHPVTDRVHPYKAVVAGALGFLAAALWWANRKMARAAYDR